MMTAHRIRSCLTLWLASTVQPVKSKKSGQARNVGNHLCGWELLVLEQVDHIAIPSISVLYVARPALNNDCQPKDLTGNVYRSRAEQILVC